MTNKLSLQGKEIIEEISAAVGDDWNSPRNRMYIAAHVLQYKQAAEKLQYELNMKEAVMDRLSALITTWFQARLKDESDTP